MDPSILHDIYLSTVYVRVMYLTICEGDVSYNLKFLLKGKAIALISLF